MTTNTIDAMLDTMIMSDGDEFAIARWICGKIARENEDMTLGECMWNAAKMLNIL